jgi:hypothetical protein
MPTDAGSNRARNIPRVALITIVIVEAIAMVPLIIHLASK